MTLAAPDGSPDGPGRNPSFLANTAALVGAAAFSQIVGFAAMLVVARLYGPFEVGIFGLFNAIFTVAVFAASWRYEMAIVTVDDDSEANDVALFIVVSGLISAAVATAVLVTVELFPTAVGLSAPLRRALAAIPLGLLFASAILAGTNICIRQRRFARVAIHQIVLTGATAIAQVLLVSADFPAGGLVGGFILGQVCGLIVFAGALTPALAASIRQSEPIRRLRAVATRHSGHFFYTVPYSLVTQLYYQMPVILLGSLVGAREAGFFSLAFRTTFTPITLVPTALAQVFFPEMVRNRDRLDEWEARLLALLVALGVLLAPAAAALIVFGPEIYASVLGEDWRTAGLFAQLLIAANLMNGLATGYDRIYFILGRQRAALIVTCLVLCLSSLLMLCAHWMGQPVAWIAGAWALAHLAMAFAWMLTIYRIAGFSPSALVARWFVVGICVALLTAALIATRLAVAGGEWTMLAAASLVLAYAWVAWKVVHPLKKLLPQGTTP
ncbi:MAG: oligosaccharide flippase family protein [Enhydrobacter sp.]|nr:MAG: oligosaccharide flippase family protein [Enhydrobacter sp.]